MAERYVRPTVAGWLTPTLLAPWITAYGAVTAIAALKIDGLFGKVLGWTVGMLVGSVWAFVFCTLLILVDLALLGVKVRTLRGLRELRRRASLQVLRGRALGGRRRGAGADDRRRHRLARPQRHETSSLSDPEPATVRETVDRKDPRLRRGSFRFVSSDRVIASIMRPAHPREGRDPARG
jgi:hypothetical protein